jgi:LmbE family N-acetylglucosaminyl deacetylase
MPRLLAYFCHPDDVEMLVAGTLYALKATGWELGIATMTSGDRGSAVHTREEISRIRSREAKAAADLLGARYVCTGLQDMEVFTNVENFRKTVEVMRTFDPDVVLTHSPVDYMVDHEETSRLVRDAAFTNAMPLFSTLQFPSAPIGRGTPVLYYSDPIEGLDPMGNRIYPQFYVDISDQIENKRQMLSCHASQREWLRSHHGLDEYINQMTSWGEHYGREAGCAYAEGFRQHLGHGYPHDPVLQTALKPRVLVRR